MTEPPSVSNQQRHGRWQFTLRSLFLLTLSVAVGLSFWKVDQDWFGGILIVISPWIVLGLAAQVRDIWSGSRQCENPTPEDRWGRRFSIFWRVALCGLMGLCFMMPFLVKFHVVVVDNGDDFSFISSREMWLALLIVSIIVAVASSPKFTRPARRRPWSWAVGLVGGVAAFVFFAVILIDRLCVPFLVHVTIAGIMSAAPLWCAEDAVATYSPGRAAQFVDVATAGVLAVLVSCALLRLLSLCWRRAAWQRVCLLALLAVSSAVMVALVARIALVEVARISPVFVANIAAPTLYRWTPAIALAFLLTAVVAYRWSKPPAAGAASNGAAWRRDEARYYHERRLLILLVGGVALAECVVMAYSMYGFFWSPWYAFGYLVEGPTGALSVALVLLAVQGVFPGRSKRLDAIVTEPPRLTPALFLLVWMALLMIVLCSAPVFAAGGFAFWLR